MTIGRIEAGNEEGLYGVLRAAGSMRLEGRFLAIWAALGLLIVFCAILAPASLQRTSIQAILPFAAFLGIAAMGQTLVIMAGGIDLSTPSIVTMVGVILLSVSGGTDANMTEALLIALMMAAAVGLINGVLVAIFRLNPLVVTLAVGTIVAGATLWYRTGIRQESRVPPSLAEFGANGLFGINYAFYVALAIMVLLMLCLSYTTVGRRFTTAGANPGAAWVAGIPVHWYTMGAYVTAAVLYGVTGVLLSAFIRNPTLELGNPYLLAPIAAAVLGGTSLTGGVGSMVAVMGAALFLTQLGQALRVMGLSTAWQFIVQGAAIAAGMALASLRWPDVVSRPLRFLLSRSRDAPARGEAAPGVVAEGADAPAAERGEGD
jgi:ribose/xylose/arabinose/galactoside ABC-type transport system permease subunit